MFILASHQVSPLSTLPAGTLTPEMHARRAIMYQGRVFILNEVHQGLQIAINRCRQFLDNNVLAIVVDHGQDKPASLWSEVQQATAHSNSMDLSRPQTAVPSLDTLVSCFEG